ncbi:hypothetical protein HGRIS_002118 [Hohenbuehelia grisea]|uniref:Transcriptional coactivator p15 (PC4) C-terminal domain-containing protein n=1 Tax=Hohenbuehelia grisea TaxID=104357 RepID=A0ABR3JLC9_9AGAR
MNFIERVQDGKPKGITRPKIKSSEHVSQSESESDFAAEETPDEDEDQEDGDEEEEEEDAEPLSKKQKTSKASKSRSKGPPSIVQLSKDGESYIDLGKGKRASVTKFKQFTLLNIREYYGAPGEEKPGKKGITLNPEQWKILRDNAGDIDRLFSEMQAK